MGRKQRRTVRRGGEEKQRRTNIKKTGLCRRSLTCGVQRAIVWLVLGAIGLQLHFGVDKWRLVTTNHDSGGATVVLQNQQVSLLELHPTTTTASTVQPDTTTTTTTDNHHPFHYHDSHKLSRLLYVGEYGLGHRLNKLTAAYHLAVSTGAGTSSSHGLNLPALQVLWGDCQPKYKGKLWKEIATITTAMMTDVNTSSITLNDQTNATATTPLDIFAYLFGGDPWKASSQVASLLEKGKQLLLLPAARKHSSSANSSIMAAADGTAAPPTIILVRNDVAGYYAGQSYKNAQVPVTLKLFREWQAKLDLDWQFIDTFLFPYFSGQTELTAFQQEHEWHLHTVIGLHIRSGNGEQDHFTDANRQKVDPVSNVLQVCQLVRQWLQRADLRQGLLDRPPIVFVATDTATLLPVLERALLKRQSPIQSGDNNNEIVIHIQKVIAFPQARVDYHQGVSYSAWTTGSECYSGWMAAAMDLMLLANADMVIASQRSTFTQIVPRAAAFRRWSQLQQRRSTMQERRWWPFCEVDTPRMTCFETELAWMFRHNNSEIATISLEPDHSAVQSVQPVVHKLLVHLPDVVPDPMQQKAIGMLRRHQISESLTYPAQVFPYGERIATKYRTTLPFRTSWVTTEEAANMIGHS